MQRAAFEEMLITQEDHWWFKGKRKAIEKIIMIIKLPQEG